MELDVSPVESMDLEYSENSSDNKYLTCNNNEQYTVIRIPQDSEKPSKHSSKKQSKRRKKSSNHSRPLPRIIVKPLPPPPPTENREWMAASCVESNSSNKPSTMREVLASIPGFCLKPRKRSSKKLSTAAQLQQTREGFIDLETPDSILVNTNIRALLNKHTFSLLPPLYQTKLGQLLPSVDRISSSGRLSSSSLNNEFFARACLEWQESLSGGEFTPENQQKMKTEAEREKSKIDPWKIKHFEPFWGEKSRKEKSTVNMNSERPSLKTTIKLRPTASITSSSTVPKVKKSKSSSNSKRMRSVGAVTRSSAKAEENEDECNVPINNKPVAPVPDLLPLKSTKSHTQSYEECQIDFNFSDSSVARTEDTVSTTPIDPLLIPDSDSVSEMKQDLDMTVVKIEETSKDFEEEKCGDSNVSNSNKRLSSNDDEYQFSKRLKFEDDFKVSQKQSDNTNTFPNDFLKGDKSFSNEYANLTFSNKLKFNVKVTDAPFLSHPLPSTDNTGSDIDINENGDVMCTSDDNVYPDQETGDTNSEDSKATISAYDFDEQSVSSMSSIKIEAHLDTIVSEQNEEKLNFNTVTDHENSERIEKDNLKDSSDNNEDVCVPETNETTTTVHGYNPSLDTDTNCSSEGKDIVEKELYKIELIKDIENKSPKDEHLEISHVNMDGTEGKSLEKCKDIQDAPNYYDEHFKDAESFIMETGGLPIIASQNEDAKYSQSNFMELTSYMNESNVTAVVTMPITQTTSLPMMEVTNTSMVSYPDDLQDPAKPKSSAILWKSENEWVNNENIITLHNFSTINNDSAKYVSEDSKTSIEDVHINDENCMYKEERDANFNMESSNSSESCQSMKEVALKDNESAPSVVSSTTVANQSLNSTTVTHSVRSGKKTKLGKESNRSRSSNKVPPGAVNLERSYQICQAVIQNSPNRDALRSQLRPPPALLTRPNRQPRPPPPVLVRQVSNAVIQHNEINENRPNNMGQYILVQRTPNVAPRASSAPPTNQNSNINVTRCRSVGAEDSCVCNLRAMILCKKCGAFCHDDCIGSAELCLTCLIR
ncbi:polycomb protein Asx [Pieris brassicae]|uniref:polycomb protein Asx n=1 Tax=Pieris brassicae TaxID=7116 RepID=UPI001E661D9C|nr:polycomb protein Asx [Pieris brassicae]